MYILALLITILMASQTAAKFRYPNDPGEWYPRKDCSSGNFHGVCRPHKCNPDEVTFYVGLGCTDGYQFQPCCIQHACTDSLIFDAPKTGYCADQAVECKSGYVDRSTRAGRHYCNKVSKCCAPIKDDPAEQSCNNKGAPVCKL